MVTKPLNPQREPLEEVPVAPPPPQDTRPSEPPSGVTPEHSGPAWRVMFNITGPQSQTVGLDVWRVTVLGRADPMSAFRPDLDYSPYGAMRHGVSRRHALLRPAENTLYLIDQRSTNGTWVNGQRLMPGQGYPLSDGDIIELGALRMALRIVESPLDNEDRQKSGERRMRGRPFSFFR